MVTTFYKAQNDGVNDGVNGGVNNIEKIIKENPGINVKGISELVESSPRTIERNIKKLRDEQKLNLKEVQKQADTLS